MGFREIDVSKAILMLAAGLLALPLAAQPAPKSVWDGIYTEAQATRGAAAYSQQCGTCHGVTLGGTGEAPGLAGPEFVSNWNTLSVGALFDRVRTTMPQSAPKSLSRETYADVVAHLLKVNGFPAGAAELDRRSEVLAGIKIVAARPDKTAAVATPHTMFAARSTRQGATPRPFDGRGGGAALAPLQPHPASAANADDNPNSQPNPYRTVTGFFKLPPGRTMGSTSAVATDSKGNIWIAERCGANSCADSKLDPIMQFDNKGNFIKAFGGGLLLFPHGFFIDKQDHIWITDARGVDGRGHQVFEFDRNGKRLRTLGKAGVAGDGPDVFNEPNAVTVAPDGTIFVADGHTASRGNARIVKFDAQGNFIKQWGSHGSGPGQMDVPHTLAMDSKGRLFVGDRWNSRVQIYDQDGMLIDTWSQFGRPSGLYIDKQDILYVADSESRNPPGYGHNPGWKRGIRIGSAVDGKVTAFIPDPEPEPDKGATSGAEGIWVGSNGVIYGAQVKERSVALYVKE